MKYIGFNILDYTFFWLSTKVNVLKYYMKYYLLYRSKIAHLERLKNSCHQKSAFVFANGPSLGKLDPDKISKYQKTGNFDVFAVNRYILSDFGQIVKPNYYVLTDPVYYGDENAHLMLEAQAYNSDKAKTYNIVEEVLQHVADYDVALFVPVQQYGKLSGKLLCNQLAFCDHEDYFSDNVINISRPRSYASFTVYKALAIACFLGYKTIYICGIDNDFCKTITVDKDNQIYYWEKHFYDRDDNTELALYKVSGYEASSMGELLYNYHLHFKTLEKFREFSIINLDPQSLVDCFSKYHSLDVYRSIEE